ncbi:hypothetical protein [Craterilacuibacter sinensis]|uniref:Uncharacterized protein n=1 Tax=Craterilacuibacter sinensis TaxID=2686017 RepID=A0A845BP51_9NEIS|nr:hypothetical protein [Craterilacuibacter sinensis]MXR38222.1 hypothetical protein [Craterilacuibacter sinensis]
MGKALAGGRRGWCCGVVCGYWLVGLAGAFGVTRSGMGKVLADARRGRCWGVRVSGR